MLSALGELATTQTIGTATQKVADNAIFIKLFQHTFRRKNKIPYKWHDTSC